MSFEQQIQHVIDHRESFKNPVTQLGKLCGQLAVSQAAEPQQVDQWKPHEGDWDALQDLLGVDGGSDRFNDHEDDVMAFVDAYKQAAYNAVHGRGTIDDACDDLQQNFTK